MDLTELRTMLPFQPSGLKYFTQQRLYIYVCLYIYKKAYHFVGQLVAVWNFYLQYWAFLCALKPTREESPSWPTWFIDVVELCSKTDR